HYGLCPALRQSLEESSDSLFNIPYDKYVELVQSLDRCSRRSQPVQLFQQPKPVQPLKPASRQSNHMDIDPIQVRSAQVSSVRMSAHRPSESPSRLSSRSSSNRRRTHGLENDLCLCCSAADHWITSCPLFPL
ncbi:hypothetical protein EJ02DRAFT_335039, partial [Clathrospora elynae]